MWEDKTNYNVVELTSLVDVTPINNLKSKGQSQAGVGTHFTADVKWQFCLIYIEVLLQFILFNGLHLAEIRAVEILVVN